MEVFSGILIVVFCVYFAAGTVLGSLLFLCIGSDTRKLPHEVLNEEFGDIEITPYVALSLISAILPILVAYIFGGIIIGLKNLVKNPAKIAHKFMSTPISELVNFKIKIERK